MNQMDQMDYVDRPTDVREGEELAADRIESYLEETIPGLEGPVQVRQYPGGASNLTYLLSFANRQLVLRRPPSAPRPPRPMTWDVNTRFCPPSVGTGPMPPARSFIAGTTASSVRLFM